MGFLDKFRPPAITPDVAVKLPYMPRVGRRRQFLSEPGEHLLLPTDVAVFLRTAQWFEACGLDGHFVVSPLIAHPIPTQNLRVADQRGPKRLRVDPAMMWHPLMWLSYRTLAPKTVPGTNRIETVDEYAIRLAVELSEAAAWRVGDKSFLYLHDHVNEAYVRPVTAADKHVQALYDPASGTWLDVLSTVGLDVDSARDRTRVEKWLRGRPDPLLESIDVDVLTTIAGRHSDWALDRTHRPMEIDGTVTTYATDLTATSTATLSINLSAKLDSLIEEAHIRPLDDLKNEVINLASVPGLLLLDGSSDDELAYQSDLATVTAHQAATADEAAEAARELSASLLRFADGYAYGIDRLVARAETESAEEIAPVLQRHGVDLNALESL